MLKFLTIREFYMKKQISHFSIWQTSKVLAIVGCIVSAIYAIPLGLIELYNKATDLAIIILLQPLVHLVLGFISFVILFGIYNWVAKTFGGIELHTEDK